MRTIIALLRPARRWINYKTLSLGLLALALSTSADMLLSAIGHGLHLLFAIVELALGHALVELLDLTHRQAQTVVAYGALGLGLLALAQALRRAYRTALRAWQATQTMLDEATRWVQSKAGWYAIATLGILGTTLYLLN